MTVTYWIDSQLDSLAKSLSQKQEERHRAFLCGQLDALLTARFQLVGDDTDAADETPN